LETELNSAGEFLLEPAKAPAGKDAPRPRTIRREELATLTNGSSGGAAAHDEHEDE
jgi:hypothetical protein